jgi:hypothetical protein
VNEILTVVLRRNKTKKLYRITQQDAFLEDNKEP